MSKHRRDQTPTAAERPRLHLPEDADQADSILAVAAAAVLMAGAPASDEAATLVNAGAAPLADCPRSGTLRT